MNTRILIWVVAVLWLLLVGGYLWYNRHPNASGIAQGKIVLAVGEAEALEELLTLAEVDPRAVRVVEADPQIPCWSHDYRNWLDHRLGVYRQFGRFGENCVGIDGQRVVSLSLVATRLSDMSPLSRLQALRQIQLRDARIAHPVGIGADCAWNWLVLSQNRLTDLNPLLSCTNLERLDVSFNQLQRLPDLRPLDKLRSLDARQNRLESVSGLAGHPSLVRIDLTANRLTGLEGLSGLPWLESLHVGSNGLTSMVGLEDLPGLRILWAHSNRLQEVEAEVTAGLPSLRFANLEGNPLNSLPPGYRFRAGPGRAVIEPLDGTIPEIEINNTPLAEILAEQAQADHDGRRRHHVDQLPRGRGRAQGTTSRGSSGGPISPTIDYEGTMAWLDGTHTQGFEVDQALSVTVTASLDRGRIRVYLADPEKGYAYAEAVPGKPAEIAGRLISGSHSYLVLFESVGGRAEGIRWRVR